ncbi:MAG: molybdopterin molybdotransferase MoeA [Elusimicrobia bacterium]|nr:molybdopterin molybdotransferase MoeA [Elusimicrobiota bacterium]
MISYAEALRRVLSEVAPLPREEVPLREALGRVCAARITSRRTLPAFDNSAMDGFAVAAAAVRRAGALLPVAGSLAAGDAPRTLQRGFACEIMTGAALPRGADAVVAVESTRRSGCGRDVVIERPCAPGDFVRRAGTDFAKGQLVADARTVLEPRHLMALAALGVSRVAVRRRPKVAVLATGKELVAPERHPRPGQVHDASSTFLVAALEAAGCEARHHGIVGDDPAEFRRRMKKILASKPDAVLSTGAVSMGKHDFVTAQVQALGARLLYHKVAIRPGKPGLVARFPRGPLFFGLPGNPISTVVGFRFFVLPCLRRALGLPDEKPARAVLAADAEKPAGLRCFFKARLEGGKVRILPGQGSFQIRPLLEADCWAVLPEAGDRARAGTAVEVHPL